MQRAALWILWAPGQIGQSMENIETLNLLICLVCLPQACSVSFFCQCYWICGFHLFHLHFKSGEVRMDDQSSFPQMKMHRWP